MDSAKVLGTWQLSCALVPGAGREGRKETSADVESLLTRLTPLIPMQIPRKGETEKVIFKAFILNSELLKNQRKKQKSTRKRKERPVLLES